MFDHHITVVEVGSAFCVPYLGWQSRVPVVNVTTSIDSAEGNAHQRESEPGFVSSGW